MIALDEANPFGFRLEVLETRDSLEVRAADLTPELGEGLKLRLDLWAQRHLGTMLAKLETRAREEIAGLR